jgi:hypothetical protein
MTNAARFRDSTQIRLPSDALAGLRAELDDRFVLTVREEGNRVRLIGSPTEIQGASGFLARHGVVVD